MRAVLRRDGRQWKRVLLRLWYWEKDGFRPIPDTRHAVRLLRKEAVTGWDKQLSLFEALEKIVAEMPGNDYLLRQVCEEI